MIPEKLRKEYFKAITLQKIKGKEFQGSSPPGIFVSSLNYPDINLGPVSLPEIKNNTLIHETPEKWFGLSSERILLMRKELINSIKRMNVNTAKNPDYDLINLQEIALSVSKSDLDVKLKKKPKPNLIYSKFNAPTTNFALLEKFSFISNPVINRKTDYIYSDFDLKADQAVKELYSQGLMVSSIQKILSVGALGVQKNRKLVPTKWSITATDDIISKYLTEKIKDYSELNEFQLFESNYLHNNFFVILMPSPFSFEMLECWLSENKKENSFEKILQDFEFINGRKNYASQITGAYYAARLAVTEHLSRIKRQASIIVIREVMPEYTQPLGVWQIRENVRHALKQKPVIFTDLNFLFKFLDSKLMLPSSYYKKKSRLIDFNFNQRKLKDWF